MGRAGTKQNKALGIRILRIVRIKKFNGLNPGDSANPDTTKSLWFFAKTSLGTA
jgi:hypothetical protein